MPGEKTHVKISSLPNGAHSVTVNGVEVNKMILAEGFGVEFGGLGHPDRVRMVVAADSLEIDLPEAVIEALRYGGAE